MELTRSVSRLSAASASPHSPALQESITKCQGEAAPRGAITEGYLDDLELVVRVSFFHPTVPRSIGIPGDMNEWLSKVAESIPSVAWKRPKLSH